MKNIRIAVLAVFALALVFNNVAVAADKMMGGHTSSQFTGPKANKGTVTHSTENGKSVLTLSDDFVVPDTPDPHWQVVDSKGTKYLLDRLPLKGDRVAKKIIVPEYVKDVKKVIIWCAFAEVNLGEAEFQTAVK